MRRSVCNARICHALQQSCSYTCIIPKIMQSSKASPQELLRRNAVRLQIKSQKGEKAAAIHDALGDITDGPGQVGILLHVP